MPPLSIVARSEEQPVESDRSDVQNILALLEGGAVPARDGALLCDLAHAVAELAREGRTRAVVRMCASREPWEIGLERSGTELLATIFRGGALPQVAVHERRLGGDAVGARLLHAIDAQLDAPIATERHAPSRFASPLFAVEDTAPALPPSAAGLACARESLAAALPFPSAAPRAEAVVVAVEPTGDVSVSFSADLPLRVQAAPARVLAAARADLFSGLFRGRLRISVGGNERDIPDIFIFLFVEQLAAMALEALEAQAQRRPFYRRLQAGGAICGIRADARGATSVTLGSASRARGERAETWTFPAVDLGAFVQGVVAFGRALARSLVRRDRAQSQNLRLMALRSLVRELGERLRETTRDESIINAEPHTYRAFAAMPKPPRDESEAFGHARLRFTAKWLAKVPSIDLRATFLCGDALLVGGASETYCLHRTTGEILWQRPMRRGVSVMTPAGLARLEPDGALRLHELSTGEVTWQTELAPRVGSAASGAVVSAPGLPRMLIVSEGRRHLCAVDLDAGEVRWRYAARRGSAFRLRRAGKLVVVASGETALLSLDVLTGEVVWRFCDRLRFNSQVAVDHDALFAIAGHGAAVDRVGARLHHIDPWSGAGRWSCDLPANVTPVGAPLLTQETVIVVAHGRGGTALLGFDRKTGAPRFEQQACSSAASCLAVDDLVVVNAESGELVGIGARDGEVRYRHVFAGGADGDRPRRLEPVLRSGALFVPQTDVQVVRPRDGVILGSVAADLVPDLLRVDERCHVYVAEESGHVAAFAAAPRLALVK